MSREKNHNLQSEKFYALVVEKLTKIFNEIGEGYSVKLIDLAVNNIGPATAVTIEHKNEKQFTAIINIDNKEWKMDDVKNTVEYIQYMYCNREEDQINDMDILLNKDYILSNVIYGVVSNKGNAAFLQDKVMKEYLDLAVIYLILAYDPKDNVIAFKVVSKELLQVNGITTEELDKVARQNTPEKNVFNVIPLEVLMNKYYSEFADEDYSEWDFSDISYLPKFMEKYPEKRYMPFMMCGSQNTQYGASIILYPEYFEALANAMDSDIYIAPLSVHECIAHPCFSDDDMRKMKESVDDVNKKNRPDEILTNSIYKYSRETKEITIA